MKCELDVPAMACTAKLVLRRATVCGRVNHVGMQPVTLVN